MVQITYQSPDGQEYRLGAQPGISIMQLATSHGVPGIIGECGGCMSCATCHVYVDDAWYERLPAPTQDELDMLELAEDPGDTSRLGCQITVTEALDGLILRVPESQ